ncbi:hypothetical protein V494_00752 [Pseudogymnoascus sp. VKM F-4513 (FW-928)]|nr:hypothetical protein V494_00752 [Pseudogymnoascus sp. VKM F-4513 (FW-928)]
MVRGRITPANWIFVRLRGDISNSSTSSNPYSLSQRQSTLNLNTSPYSSITTVAAPISTATAEGTTVENAILSSRDPPQLSQLASISPPPFCRNAALDIPTTAVTAREVVEPRHRTKASG